MAIHGTKDSARLLSPKATPAAQISGTAAVRQRLHMRLQSDSFSSTGTSCPPESSTKPSLAQTRVSAPVATAIPTAKPLITVLVAYSILVRSVMGTSPPPVGSGTEFFDTIPSLSVTQPSETKSPSAAVSLMSHGTVSPLSRIITSPGAISSAPTFLTFPPRTTLTCGRAARAFFSSER